MKKLAFVAAVTAAALLCAAPTSARRRRTTSIYLEGIDTEEIIATIHARRAPMTSATAGLQF